MTTTSDLKPATRIAPAALAVASIIVGLFVPFIGLPISMISVVAIGAANIEERRLLTVTVAIVALAILSNLVLVMVALS